MPTHLKQKKQADSKTSLGVGRRDSMLQLASCDRCFSYWVYFSKKPLLFRLIGDAGAEVLCAATEHNPNISPTWRRNPKKVQDWGASQSPQKTPKKSGRQKLDCGAWRQVE